jgi:5-methylcytosine-specific restriction endonuclease McrA
MLRMRFKRSFPASQADEAEVQTVIREKVLERDGWQCQTCGSRSNLEVHHLEFRSHGGSNDPKNLIVLCHSCHLRRHQVSGDYFTLY